MLKFDDDNYFRNVQSSNLEYMVHGLRSVYTKKIVAAQKNSFPTQLTVDEGQQSTEQMNNNPFYNRGSNLRITGALANGEIWGEEGDKKYWKGFCVGKRRGTHYWLLAEVDNIAVLLFAEFDESKANPNNNLMMRRAMGLWVERLFKFRERESQRGNLPVQLQRHATRRCPS